MTHVKKRFVILFVLLSLLTSNLIAQSDSLTVEKDSLDKEDGIHFEPGFLWKDILAKAKANNKSIFVDFYATWCGPCKWMATNIYPQPVVGEFFNTNFINVAVQVDKTPGDDQAVRGWYEDARALKKEYNVSEYPTFLFFSPEGKVVHRFIGSANDGNEFIAKATEALDPARQYYTLLSGVEDHLRDTAYLWKVYESATHLTDREGAKIAGEAYLDAQQDLFTRKNLLLISKCGLLGSSKSKWFQFYLRNTDRIDDSLDGYSGEKHFVEWELRQAIFSEEVKPLLRKDQPVYWQHVAANLQEKYGTIWENLQPVIKAGLNDEIDYEISKVIRSDSFRPEWSAFEQRMREMFPDFDFREVLLKNEAQYYEKEKEWTECSQVAFDLMRHYSSQLDELDLNNLTWYWVFLHCDDRRILKTATEIMNRVVKMHGKDKMFLDTYANLLYKDGKRKEALRLESNLVETAIKEHASPGDLQIWRTNLDNMRNGKPTWGDNAAS